MGLVARFTPQRVSFTFSLTIVYLLLLGMILGLALTLGSRLVDEANSFATQLPSLLKNGHALDQLPLPAWLEPMRQRIDQTLQDELNSGGTDILPYAKSLGGHLITGARYIVYIVLIPILAFFFLKDGRSIQEDIVDGLVDESRRPVVESFSRTSTFCWANTSAPWCCCLSPVSPPMRFFLASAERPTPFCWPA